MSILRVSHLGICVSDMQRSLCFYRDLLGFAPVSTLEVSGEPSDTLLGLEGVDLEAAYLELDGVCIELLYFARPEAGAGGHDEPINRLGLTHLSLRVEDLPATVEGLARAGVETTADHALKMLRRHPTDDAAVFTALQVSAHLCDSGGESAKRLFDVRRGQSIAGRVDHQAVGAIDGRG